MDPQTGAPLDGEQPAIARNAGDSGDVSEPDAPVRAVAAGDDDDELELVVDDEPSGLLSLDIATTDGHQDSVKIRPVTPMPDDPDGSPEAPGVNGALPDDGAVEIDLVADPASADDEPTDAYIEEDEPTGSYDEGKTDLYPPPAAPPSRPAVPAPGPANGVRDAAIAVTPGHGAHGDDPGDDDAGFDEGETEVFEDLDEIEELQDEAFEAMEPVQGAPPPPPTPPATPPPTPGRTGPVARQTGAQAAQSGPMPAQSGPILAQTGSVPVGLPPPVPLEQQLETPTAVDRALASLGEAGLEARAARLAARIELLAAEDDRARVGALAYELGELYERRLADEARAVKSYKRSLQADPSLRANLWAIRRVFYRRGLWPNLVKLIDAEIRFAPDDTVRADLMVEKGILFEDRMGDRSEARSSYEDALICDPEHVPALLRLERLAIGDRDAAALGRVWTQLGELAQVPARKLGYLLDVIELQIREAGDLELARDLIADAVALGIDVARVARLRLRLGELLDDPDEMLAALEALIVHLGASLQGTATEGADGAEDDAEGAAGASAPEPRTDERRTRLEMVALRRRQARLAGDALGDPERAWGYLQKALALVPGEPLLMADLADLAEQLGRFDELAELVEGWQALEDDPAVALGLSLRRADALFRAGQRDEGRAVLASVAATAPGYLPVTAMAERDALEARDWQAWATALLAAGDAAMAGTVFGPGASLEPDRAVAAALYTGAGDVLAMRVADPGAARRAYNRALEAEAGYPPAFEGLCDLLVAQGKSDEAAQLLELHADAAEGEPLVHMLERLAEVYTELDHPDGLVSALERLWRLADGDIRVAWRLEAALGEAGHDERRVEVLCAIADGSADPARAGRALALAADLCDRRLDDPERAATLYRRVLEAWPGERYSRAALSALLRRAGAWEELVALRRSEAAQLEDGPALSRALCEAAELLATELDRPADAADVYRELLARMPGDLRALHGLAALLEGGDDEGAVEILEEYAASCPGDHARAAALLRLARAWERQGRPGDALEVYRRAAEVDPGLSALVAWAELAAATGSSSARAEALEILAARLATDDGDLAAALREDVAWSWLLVMEDFDRAAEAFAEAAGEGETAAVGALLGASLVAARRGDAHELAGALGRIADALETPYTASALHLRGAAIAEVAGEPDEARGRVRAALAAAPDDAGTLVAAAELLATIDEGAGGEPETARQRLLSRAELFATRAALAGAPSSRDDWELERAEALEAAGRLRDAAAITAVILRGNPDDVRALELLRRICRRGGDRAALARASLALARVIGDRAGKLTLYTEAVGILDGELDDLTAAVPVYRRILAEEPGAAEFDRLHAILREAGDVRGLVEILGDRLDWLDDTGGEPAARVTLLLERAELRGGVGDDRGAARDLRQLLAIDDAHGPALALLGRLQIRLGEPAEGAELLSRYLAVETDPVARSEAELLLSEVLAENMDDIEGAVAALRDVVHHAPDDLDVRERLVALLLKAGDAQAAAGELGEIAARRDTDAERARDELRRAAVLRDRGGDEAGARAALERARTLDPLNLDAVRELADLAGVEGKKARRKVLAGATADVRAAIVRDPTRGAVYERLAALAGWLEDDDTRYFALAAKAAVGAISADQRAFVDRYRKDLPQEVPGEVLSADDYQARLAHPQLSGAAAEIWAVIAEGVTSSLGLDAGKLGFGRGERVSARNVERQYPPLARALALFGVSTAEVYVSVQKAGFARVLGAGKPVLLLGADVACAETPAARFALGRCAAQARDGTGTLAELRGDELALLLAGAARLAGLERPPTALASLLSDEASAVEERARALHKHLGRRERKSLGQLATTFDALEDPATWRRAALATAARAGLLLCGDVAVALDMLDVGRGGRSLVDDRAALGLLAWSVSGNHVALRQRLGLARTRE